MNITYYNDLWIIGTVEQRRAAERQLNLDLDVTFCSVYHPDQGHEVASVAHVSTPNQRLFTSVERLAPLFSDLVWVIADCDEDGGVPEWNVVQGSRVTKQAFEPDDDVAMFDVDETLHALRRVWHPWAMTKAWSVRCPMGSDLDHATWCDHGEAVAELLTNPANRPEHPEMWWVALEQACRRTPAWVDVSNRQAQALDGRGRKWSQSAASAWAQAFPEDLRDVNRWIETLKQGSFDVPTKAALAHWLPSSHTHRLYKAPDASFSSRGFPFSLAPTDPGLSEEPDLLVFPADLTRCYPAARTEHLRLLDRMVPASRDRFLLEWLTMLPGHLTDESPLVDTLDLLYHRGYAPTAWFEPATIAVVREQSEEGRSIHVWLERHALHNTVNAKNPVRAMPLRGRARL